MQAAKNWCDEERVKKLRTLRQSKQGLGRVWLVNNGLSTNEQYFSLIPNQSSILSAMIYQPNKLKRTGRIRSWPSHVFFIKHIYYISGAARLHINPQQRIEIHWGVCRHTFASTCLDNRSIKGHVVQTRKEGRFTDIVVPGKFTDIIILQALFANSAGRWWGLPEASHTHGTRMEGPH